MDVPWFMLSPSPVSLIQYGILTWFMWGYLRKAGNYEDLRFPRLLSLLDGFFVVAFFVCITDAFWVLFTAWRWLPLYPGDIWLLAQSMIRDIAGASLFLLLIWDHFKSGALQFSKTVLGWLLICFFYQFVWFWLAESPGITDYVYAWRHGYPEFVILGGWTISHFIMRFPLWAAILKTRLEVYS